MHLNDVLVSEINKLDYRLIPEGFTCEDMSSFREMQELLKDSINNIGTQSAEAQGLKKLITSAEKLEKDTDQTLYLLKDSSANGGRGAVVGMLKVGRKHLFLYDEHNTVHEVEPLCVLDFYVCSERQRTGLGRKLFDHMLQEQNILAEQMPVDGPSPKMEQFLRKNYGVPRLLRQGNNFSVSPLFFEKAAAGDIRSGRCSPAHPQVTGRFSAPKPQSSIGQVIHGSRSASRVATPDMTLEDKSPVRAPKPEPEPAQEPEPEPAAEPERSPERPTSLPVEVRAEAAVSPAGSASRHDAQLTDRGYFDVKFYHNKLW